MVHHPKVEKVDLESMFEAREFEIRHKDAKLKKNNQEANCLTLKL